VAKLLLMKMILWLVSTSHPPGFSIGVPCVRSNGTSEMRAVGR
jgi:hypothetical protein